MNIFTKNEVKFMLKQMFNDLHEISNTHLEYVWKEINTYNQTEKNGVKFAYRSWDNDGEGKSVIIIEYSYTSKNNRNKGNFIKSMDEFNKDFDVVLYEPSPKWFLNNLDRKSYPSIRSIQFNDGVTDYFIYKSNSDSFLTNYQSFPCDGTNPIYSLSIIDKSINKGVIKTYIQSKYIKEFEENFGKDVLIKSFENFYKGK